MEPEHLYLHVPFCLRRCPYCDFAVTVDRRPPVEGWVEAIRGELAGVAAAEGWELPLRPRTIYLGGGTPSLLGGGGPRALRRATEALIDWTDRLEEWTAEANPESFDAEVADGWREAGVDRVSLGVQTFHPPALRWMGRLHGPDGAASAVRSARAAGFDNLSLDLIFGLPDRLGRDWAADLDRALALEPEHLSLYGLTAEPGTPLGRWVEAGREALPGEEDYESEYLLAVERAGAAGLLAYEVSNFAVPGREARHNAAYWRRVPYLGLGPGAHSFLPPERRWNLRDWSAYRGAVATGRSPVAQRERLEEGADRLERIWLSLRARSGLAPEPAEGAAAELVAEWRRLGYAAPGDGAVCLTPRGWLLLDRLAVELEHALDAVSAPSAHSRRGRGEPGSAR